MFSKMKRRKLKVEELNRISIEEFQAAEKIPLVIVLDNVRSRNNIGSVFRTSDAFRVKEILLCGITATPPDAEIHKTALGSEDSVKWRYFEKKHYRPFSNCDLKAIQSSPLSRLRTVSHWNQRSWTKTKKICCCLRTRSLRCATISYRCFGRVYRDPAIWHQALSQCVGCCRYCNMGFFFKKNFASLKLHCMN